MKLAKMLGLAMVASVAVMAFAGAGNAWALETGLCMVNEEPCEAANLYPAGTKIVQNLGTQEAVLKNTIGEIKCKKSTIEGELLEAQGPQQLKGKITNATWSECTRSGTTEECSVKALQLPWQAHLERNEPQDGNGTLWIGPWENKATNGQPGVEFTNCVLKGCAFKAAEKQTEQVGGEKYENEWARLTVSHETRTDTANQILLKTNNPFGCGGAEPHWSAVYHTVEPTTEYWVSR